MPDIQAQEPILVGEIGAPFGIRGEVRMLPLLRRVEMLVELDSVILETVDGSRRPVRIAAVRKHQGLLLVRLEGFPDRTAIERLRGAVIKVEADQFETLPEGEWYEWQLLGLPVRTTDGSSLGSILKVHFSAAANDVWETETALIPAVADFVVSVDLDSGVVVRDDPGMRK